MIQVAELMRTLDAIKNGEADTLNNETLLWLESMLDNAKLRCENIRLRRAARPLCPAKLSFRERKQYLRDYIAQHGITGAETFEVLEQHGKQLRAAGFYATTTGNADIVYRLRDTSKKMGGAK